MRERRSPQEIARILKHVSRCHLERTFFPDRVERKNLRANVLLVPFVFSLVPRFYVRPARDGGGEHRKLDDIGELPAQTPLTPDKCLGCPLFR